MFDHFDIATLRQWEFVGLNCQENNVLCEMYSVIFPVFLRLPTIMSQPRVCFFLSLISRGITLFPLSSLGVRLAFINPDLFYLQWDQHIHTHTQVYHSGFSLLCPMEKPAHRPQWGTLCNHGALSIKRNMISVVLIWNHVLRLLC